MKERCSNRSGFTVVEVLAILAVIAVLGTLLVPGYAKASKSQITAMRCLDNKAQLIKAWQLYAADSDEYVANNYTIPGTQAAINSWRTGAKTLDLWAPNVMSWAATGADANSVTNKALAQAGSLVRYHGNIEAYRCPADNFRSAAQRAARFPYRLRSVGMNSNWGRSDPTEPKTGTGGNSWAYGAAFRQWYKTSEVKKPQNMYVFVDEHADSVNDGFFLVTFGGGGGAGEYPSTVSGGSWGDIPGFYHSNGATFGFADGHTELKRWVSRPIPVRAGMFTTGPAHIQDQQWYVRHVAERR